jgi:hypothetical protein
MTGASGTEARRWLPFRCLVELQAHLYVPCRELALFWLLAALTRRQTARILHLPPPDALPFAAIRHPAHALPFARERCHRRVPCISRAVRTHGTAATTPEPAISVHARPEPRVLGTERMGASHHRRPRAAQVYVPHRTRSRESSNGLHVVAGKLGIALAADAPGVASTSRGLVGDTVFAVLPNIKPIHCFAITLAFQTVRCYRTAHLPVY